MCTIQGWTDIQERDREREKTEEERKKVKSMETRRETRGEDGAFTSASVEAGSGDGKQAAGAVT